MSDEGTGRPIEAWEETNYARRMATEYGSYKFPYDEDPQDVTLERLPLNVADVVSSRMRGMSSEELERVVVAAGIMFQESAEGVGIVRCLFVATEMERRRQ